METITANSGTHCNKHIKVQHAVLLPTHNHHSPQKTVKPIYLGGQGIVRRGNDQI